MGSLRVFILNELNAAECEGLASHRPHCVPFGVDQAVLYYWHCSWTTGGGRSKFLGLLEEQDGAAFWPLPAH